MKLLQNFTLCFSKKMIEKYVPFIGKVWSIGQFQTFLTPGSVSHLISFLFWGILRKKENSVKELAYELQRFKSTSISKIPHTGDKASLN